MVWIASLAATELPAVGLTVTIRCSYGSKGRSKGSKGEQPDRSAAPPSIANIQAECSCAGRARSSTTSTEPRRARSATASTMAREPRRLLQDVSIGALQIAAGGDEFVILLLALGLAHQEQVDVVGLHRGVER